MLDQESREYKSYLLDTVFSLFDDIESDEIRNHNRAATMANMVDMGRGKKGDIINEVEADISNYFEMIGSVEDKADVLRRIIKRYQGEVQVELKEVK